ncbi:DUF1211 domain-containing protein [Flavobacteriaceae bacterium D16]|nr:DUF1211 domain-containing protein [Flavobacteriaceae bacterium D16]
MKFLHDSKRVEAFSDGVFAFAATLMVVSLDLNESFVLMESKSVSFISFGVSFFVLVALWKVHYNFFRRTAYMDDWIIAFNAILLFVVLYYVFPLKSLVNSFLGKEPVTMDGLASLFELYSAGFLMIFLCLALMYYRAYRKTKSVDRSLYLLFYARHFGIYVGVALISIALSGFKIGIIFGFPGIVYALLGPLCYWHANWFEKKFRFPLS